jgi:hypothetical protein
MLKTIIFFSLCLTFSYFSLLSNDNDSLYFGMTSVEQSKLSEFIEDYYSRGYHNEGTYYTIANLHRVEFFRELIHKEKLWYDFFDYENYQGLQFDKMLEKLQIEYGKLVGWTIESSYGDNTYDIELYFCENRIYFYQFFIYVSSKEIGYDSDDLELAEFNSVKKYDIVAYKYDYEAWLEFSKDENDILIKYYETINEFLEENCEQ